MLRAFIDSSVLFSAAYSERGHARDLMIMAAKGQVRLVISELVLEETRRNLADFAPQAIPALEILLDILDLEIVHPSRKVVLEASQLVAPKDAPILAAAKVAQWIRWLRWTKSICWAGPNWRDTPRRASCGRLRRMPGSARGRLNRAAPEPAAGPRCPVDAR